MNGQEFVISLLPSVFKEHEIIGISNYSDCVYLDGINPNKLTGFDTKNCLYFLLRRDSIHLDKLSPLGGITFTLDEYWSFVESHYKPLKRLPEQDFRPHTYLASMVHKQRMFMNFNNHLLWSYTMEQVDSDFCVTFDKVYWFNGEEYNVSITFANLDGDEMVSKNYASRQEIVSSNGDCLRINYPDKKFQRELNKHSILSEELENITKLGATYMSSRTNNLKKETKRLISLV